jgi:hypothetical protein
VHTHSLTLSFTHTLSYTHTHTHSLSCTPLHSLPVILKRLRQKDSEWRKVKLDMKGVWRKINEQNYQRSLDHRSFYFKQVCMSVCVCVIVCSCVYVRGCVCVCV